MTIIRIRASGAALAFSLIAGCASIDGARNAVGVTQYVGALWYDGEKFIPRDAFVKDGFFVNKPRGEIGDVRDLAGAFVVPGFAEAHHHTVLCDPERIDQFLKSGIFYVAVMNARVGSRECQEKLHPSNGLEVVSALAGLTARNAHPSQIGEYFLEPDAIDGEWVHYVDDASELERKWPAILATKPDYLKIFLSYSEDYAALRADASLASWYRGLDPSLAAPIVERAHAAGLRVAAHVMSAHDFKIAVAAGVDIVAHMPGFAPGAAFTEDDPHPYLAAAAADVRRYLIEPNDARRAAQDGVAVITTVSGADGPPTEAIAANFAALKTAGVTLLIGSDRGEYNSVDEFVYLTGRNLMTPSDALRSLSVLTPRALLPQRKIGALSPGYEASFIALGGDPLATPAAVRNIRLVVKSGEELEPKGAAPAN